MREYKFYHHFHQEVFFIRVSEDFPNTDQFRILLRREFDKDWHTPGFLNEEDNHFATYIQAEDRLEKYIDRQLELESIEILDSYENWRTGMKG